VKERVRYARLPSSLACALKTPVLGGETVSCRVLGAPREYEGYEYSGEKGRRPNAVENVFSRALVVIQEHVFRF